MSKKIYKNKIISNNRIKNNRIGNKKIKKNKVIAIIIIILISVTVIGEISIKKINNVSKKNKIGNNSSSQEIVDYILDINSYEAQLDIEVKSNKNTNKYKIKQKYNNNYIEQEVIEPSNIEGIKIIKENNNLKIENSKLNLSKIIENYNEISTNNLDLKSFIENYRNSPNAKFKEEKEEIIMETTVENTKNKYQKYEKLYISKKNHIPTKMEIIDTNQNTIIYIIYNEIEIYT